MTTPRPLVSVVTATYNRCEVLGHAIRSVRASTIPDWEHIVVGDHCSDGTAEVVARFGDERLTFVNLAENSGDQAAPNNRGVSLARGRYVAFLNHDDLFFPDHLESSIRHLEASGADLVWSPCAAIRPASKQTLDDERWEAELWGVSPSRDYSPLSFYCASSWVMRKELCNRVGPWRSADRLWVTPSQDWLFRAWRSGARLQNRDRVSVLLIVSGLRRDSYLAPASVEHEYFSARLGDPQFRERLLESAAIHTAEVHLHKLFHRPVAGLLRSLATPVYGLLTRLGTHPFSANAMFWPGGRFGIGRRGRGVREIRRYTGLDV